jgi:hypothetical protein
MKLLNRIGTWSNTRNLTSVVFRSSPMQPSEYLQNNDREWVSIRGGKDTQWGEESHANVPKITCLRAWIWSRTPGKTIQIPWHGTFLQQLTQPEKGRWFMERTVYQCSLLAIHLFTSCFFVVDSNILFYIFSGRLLWGYVSANCLYWLRSAGGMANINPELGCPLV